ncbi:hypothetical protein D3C81_1788960 [compost metagenome]
MRSNRFSDTFCQLNALTGINGIGHDRKLFPAHARHQPVLAHHLLHLPGERGQHPVATLMTIVVINAFEVVDIEQHHGQKTGMTMGLLVFQRFIQT